MNREQQRSRDPEGSEFFQILPCVARLLLVLVGFSLLVACGGTTPKTPTPRPLVCSTTTQGCSCGTAIVGDGSQVCDAQSVVKNAGQQGYCCKTDFVCQCRVRECAYSAANQSCVCGNPQANAGDVRVNDCSQATGLICCFIGFACICSTSPCGAPSESVPNCAVADVTKCDPSEQTVASCK
jgi:hypothetical protein